MSVSVLPPTAPTTLVIMLGASAWPNSPGFQASEAFVHAAHGFSNYLLDPHGFGLTTANLLNQFDAQSSSSDQLELLGTFLEERAQALSAANQAARDVLVYFVGHGGFAGPSTDFYLLLRRTNARSLRASGMAIDALAEVLREKARQMRRYLLLDCCFAAAAFRAFQGGPDQAAITKTLDAFAVQARSSGFPRRGTVLLCSSDQKSPSLLLPDESCTMFSHALLDVLKNGDLHRQRQLSLRDIKELAEDRLAALPESNAPRPGLHSPDQSEGDVADIPLFPNLFVERERARLAEEESRQQAERLRRTEGGRQHPISPDRQTLDGTISPKNTLFVLLCFEGPDVYSTAGGLGTRISELSEALAMQGYTTHLIFIGDPYKPSTETRIDGRLVLKRWSQWVSKYYLNGVYDGEEQKLNDYNESVPYHIYDEIVRPAAAMGKTVVIMGEEWHTAEVICRTSDLLGWFGLRQKVLMLWNLNSLTSLDRINWSRLKSVAHLCTVSEDVRQKMLDFDVNPLVIPNGIPSRLLASVEEISGELL